MNYKNIPFGDFEKFNVIIEIPKGSENKYEYDEKLDAVKLQWVFKKGFGFPFDYGFIPQTLAEDNDEVDVFVIAEHSFYPNIVVECKPIGMIDVLDRGEKDNKIIAIPLADPDYSKYESLNDLFFDYKKVFKDFFKELGIQKDKKIEITGFSDKTAAIEYIKESLEKPQ
ncbi:MAG: inorganic pyrophosphatase [Candidatus Nealsonbacteria bacterium CG_4_10_14_0_2_um_filter_38_17]|uniref:inorganic diphosphatase n=2 Tax=Candidatus Nealsoniibacteriota TaxID=1817911 RepID=A0A2M7UXJ3_9BACT|nr:MAG: inorganic pyrophosphatase [Candidatus Nealsonbacteria bacterium CG23_combo_of_CG06-09_8_20_14_all_38_19]PIZ88585.1 MAG: inorganic pyrophosphatase [Candidatus Nealsonbacteria bacterium CG_4_10_14_0_2_um_filter_38_17]